MLPTYLKNDNYDVPIWIIISFQNNFLCIYYEIVYLLLLYNILILLWVLKNNFYSYSSRKR